MNAHRSSRLEITVGDLGGRSSGVEGRISSGEAGEVAERVETRSMGLSASEDFGGAGSLYAGIMRAPDGREWEFWLAIREKPTI